MFRSGICLVVCVFFGLGVASGVRAEDAVSAENAAAMSPKAWDAVYDQARLLLRDGHFREAAEALSAAAVQAPDQGRKRLALEQSWLAVYWSKQGYQLELLAPDERRLGGDGFRDRRTTDELAGLYISSVFYGIGSGVALGMFTEPDSAAGWILPSLALSAASVGLIYAIDKPLRYGGAQAISSGLFVGFEEGLVWVLWNQNRSDSRDGLSTKAITGVLWGASTAGALAGGLVGEMHGITPGRASLVGSGALWSALVAGLGVGALTDSPDSALLSAALALNVGALGGLWLGDGAEPSIGRVRFLDLGGISGALIAGGLYLSLFDVDGGPRRFLGVTAAGTLGGLIVAWQLTSHMAPDNPSRRSTTSAMVPTVMPVRDGGGVILGVGGLL